MIRNEKKCDNRKNSIPTQMTYMNNFLFEIENTRVPILLIWLSEISLLKGNRNLKTARVTILTRYLIFEIENASEKEMKGKQRSLNMAN